MHEIANIDKFGRIPIPKKMRAVLGLHSSGRVGIESRDHELVLKPMYKKADAWAKQFFEETLPPIGAGRLGCAHDCLGQVPIL